jgi:hypothetical protein
VHHGARFTVLRFMMALKAAREFGLDARTAAEIAGRFDSRRPESEHLVDALADALIARGAVRVPDIV